MTLERKHRQLMPISRYLPYLGRGDSFITACTGPPREATYQPFQTRSENFVLLLKPRQGEELKRNSCSMAELRCQSHGNLPSVFRVSAHIAQ